MTLPAREPAPGSFIISLDFELHWGVRDVKTVEQYRENLLGVRRAVSAMLAAFVEYDIHATWATVGFLFFSRRNELLRALPIERPQYDDPRLSPYAEIDGIGENEGCDPYHFGHSLLEEIRTSPGQEIGTHTFSHYYCLEPKQSVVAFRADLAAARAAGEAFGVALTSIVFPRNQYDQEHLRVCRQMGLMAFRGNLETWLYRTRRLSEERRWVRAARLADSYCDLSSHNCYVLPQAGSDLPGDLPINLPGSRFLRPYNSRVTASQALQERRIKNDLTYAAQNGLAYHLWWHPHNFGANLGKSIETLRRILEHFRRLKECYWMRSMNMAECTLEQPPVQDHVVIEENRLARPRR